MIPRITPRTVTAEVASRSNSNRYQTARMLTRTYTRHSCGCWNTWMGCSWTEAAAGEGKLSAGCMALCWSSPIAPCVVWRVRCDSACWKALKPFNLMATAAVWSLATAVQSNPLLDACQNPKTNYTTTKYPRHGVDCRSDHQGPHSQAVR